MGNDTDLPPLGECPICETDVPVEKLGITYRPENGYAKMLAECPECETAVHPE
jgi:endogenous inhibitor of DNA gyrase (YacG/DUF329 family)